jgi:hypothetical protein
MRLREIGYENVNCIHLVITVMEHPGSTKRKEFHD